MYSKYVSKVKIYILEPNSVLIFSRENLALP
jgi:hypothetical protein